MVYAHLTFALTIITLLVSLAILYVYVRNPRNKEMLFNFLVFLGSAISLFGLFNIQINTDPTRAVVWTRLTYAGLSGFIFSLPLFVATVTRWPLGRNARIVLANISLVFIFLSLFTESFITSRTFWYAQFLQGEHGRLHSLFVTSFLMIIGYSYGQLIVQSRKNPNPVYDYRPIMIGAAASILIGVVDAIGVLMGRPVLAFLPHPLILALFIAVVSFIWTFLSQYSWVLRSLTQTEQELQALLEKSNRNFLEFVQLIAKTLDAKDHYTAGHSLRVMSHAVRIGQNIGLPESELELLKQACLLHDIGKICIPDGILNKKSPLSDHEREHIIKHPIVGRQILSTVSDFHGILDVIFAHHERVDGQGYPKGLDRNEIPLLARILSVADTFDAICSERPYRRARTRDQAIDELKKVRGSQLDERIVDAFLEILQA